MLEYCDNYSKKTSGSLQQYCRDEPNYTLKDRESFNFKLNFAGNATNEGRKNVEIAAISRCPSNF